MCGIAGYCNMCGLAARVETIHAMTSTLRHRGPDGMDVFVEGPVHASIVGYWGPALQANNVTILSICQNSLAGLFTYFSAASNKGTTKFTL